MKEEMFKELIKSIKEAGKILHRLTKRPADGCYAPASKDVLNNKKIHKNGCVVKRTRR